jgi:hypothetical protein
VASLCTKDPQDVIDKVYSAEAIHGEISHGGRHYRSPVAWSKIHEKLSNGANGRCRIRQKHHDDDQNPLFLSSSDVPLENTERTDKEAVMLG